MSPLAPFCIFEIVIPNATLEVGEIKPFRKDASSIAKLN